MLEWCVSEVIVLNDRDFLNLIYDFYGELLTQKQKDIFESRYYEDLSFQEMGEIFSVSKQAVSDMLKRTEKKLLNFEKKLRLAEKFLKQQEAVKKAAELLEIGEKEKVKEILRGILELE